MKRVLFLLAVVFATSGAFAQVNSENPFLVAWGSGDAQTGGGKAGWLDTHPKQCETVPLAVKYMMNVNDSAVYLAEVKLLSADLSWGDWQTHTYDVLGDNNFVHETDSTGYITFDYTYPGDIDTFTVGHATRIYMLQVRMHYQTTCSDSAQNASCDMYINFGIKSFSEGTSTTCTGGASNITGADVGTSIDKVVESSMGMYPNPAKAGEVVRVISSNFTGDVNVALFNVAGQKVYESMGDIQNIEVPTAGFTKGVYMLEISNGVLRDNKKLLIK